MYRIVIKRCEKDNPLTGRAAYRVVNAWSIDHLFNPKVYSVDNQMVILLPRPRHLNTFINPSKAMFPPNKKGVKA